MPTLSVAALQKQIAAGKLSAVHLFVGEDVKLMARMVDAVEATVDPADRPFAVERLYAGESGGTPVDIAAAARAFPMLGDRRIVIVVRAERLLKPKRATSSAEAEDAPADAVDESPADVRPLEDYLKAPVPSTTLVFVATAVDKARSFTKKLDAAAHVTTFAGIGGDDASGRRFGRTPVPDWLPAEIAVAGREIDPTALQLLVTRSADDVTKLRGDLERLLLYTEGQPRISKEDVEEVATDEVAGDHWEVLNALRDGDTPRALRAVATRLDHGDSPHAVVGQLRWWVSSELASDQPERAKPALEALLRTDIAMKSSIGDERTMLERLVVELAGKPIRRRGWR